MEPMVAHSFSLSHGATNFFFVIQFLCCGLLTSQPLPTSNPVPQKSTSTSFVRAREDKIILNPRFEDGLNNWSGKGCKIGLHESLEDGEIIPQSGKFFASATERTEKWNGIEQEITGRVEREIAYQVTAVARIYGGNVTSANLQITLWVQELDFREEYIAVANLQATDKEWLKLEGEFLLNGLPSRAIIFVEGPPSGIDILINSLVVRHAGKVPASTRPFPKSAAPFEINIIENSNFQDGTNEWFLLGNCTVSVEVGSPHVLPRMARDSLGSYKSLSGRYILVTNRSDSWMGPAQIITDKLKPYLTYQVSAWVRTGPGAISPQIINVAFGVDGQWMNGGEVECIDDKWNEIGGSFRIEKQPTNVMVYVQGPAAGVDLMVSGLQVFAVDRRARFKYLKNQTDKIRKRDVILRLGTSDVVGNSIKITQLQNSFPLGSCITRTSLDNDEFVKFLVNFNWVVFENEMKWSWTEPQQGKSNYKNADEMLEFCNSHNLQVRGHCIFWDMEYAIQQWVRSLNRTDLMAAVQNRITELLTRYKGKMRHYDVNNEMLHGTFYEDRLGNDIGANMFKAAHRLDTTATLFVNDYHIEDGSDIRSTPEKYIEQVVGLQAKGAQVGGIGIQAHIDVPIGAIVGSALDKLATLGLPVWFTELDVSSSNEYIRADDLEVMLREAFAHPAVEGVILWGFWELYMSRKNAHLVNANGNINAAGRRFLALRKEWLSNTDGRINEQGEFRFRGFHGTYNVEIVSSSGKLVNKTLVVDPGEYPLVVSFET